MPASTIFHFTGGFFVGRDVYNEYRDPTFVQALTEAHRNGAAFVIYLGNFNDPSKTNCAERSYRDMDCVVQNGSRIPVLFLNGSQDYVRFPNPFQAFSYWAGYMGRVERHWPEESSDDYLSVRRSADRLENFVFMHKRVLFLGLDVVTGEVTNVTDPDGRRNDNCRWVKKWVVKHYQDVEDIVLFGNEAPNDYNHRSFFRALILSLGNRGRRFVTGLN